MSQNPGMAPNGPQRQPLSDLEIQQFHRLKQLKTCQLMIQAVEDEIKYLEGKGVRAEQDPHNVGCVTAIRSNINQNIQDKTEDLKALKRIEAKLTGRAQSSLPQQSHIEVNTGPVNAGTTNTGPVSSSTFNNISVGRPLQQASPGNGLSIPRSQQLPQVPHAQPPVSWHPSSFHGSLNIAAWASRSREQQRPQAQQGQPPSTQRLQQHPPGQLEPRSARSHQSNGAQAVQSPELLKFAAEIWKSWPDRVQRVAQPRRDTNTGRLSGGSNILRRPPGGFMSWRDFEKSEHWNDSWTKIQDVLACFSDVSRRRIEDVLDEINAHFNQLIHPDYMPSTGSGMITRRFLESIVALGTSLRAVEQAGLLSMPWLKLFLSRIELKAAQMNKNGMNRNGRRLLEDICHQSEETYFDAALYEIYQTGLKLKKSGHHGPSAGQKRHHEALSSSSEESDDES